MQTYRVSWRRLGIHPSLAELLPYFSQWNATLHLPPRAEMPMITGALDRAMRWVRPSQLTIPDFSKSSEVRVYSDFSSMTGRWRAYTFLVVSRELEVQLLCKLSAFRRQNKIEDGRRFEYKSMKDSRRWKLSEQWLQNFSSAGALLVCVLVRNDCGSLFRTKGNEDETLTGVIKQLGFGDWATTSSGTSILEEALRIVHCVSFLHSLVTRGSVPLRWVCDNDEILDGATRRPAVERMLPAVVEKYSQRPLPCSLTTEMELGDHPSRDLLSLPDLVSAALLEYQTGVETDAKDMIAKAGVVCSWLGEHESIQKGVLRIVPDPDDPNGVLWDFFKAIFQFDFSGFSPPTAENLRGVTTRA